MNFWSIPSTLKRIGVKNNVINQPQDLDLGFARVQTIQKQRGDSAHREYCAIQN